MKTLHIRWQRLVNEEGRTCDRCGATGAAVEEAARRLRDCLRETGVEVTLEREELSPSFFARDPLQSNRIWIAGEPLETWLAAGSGKSRCCDACGDADCRTITVAGATYEAIPADLIVKAGLLAAARLLGKE